ncbi:MAG TPA: helix-turn-helix transcriptional regulator [Acidimicrobiales bacterium]|nr:helix-turn-helix transcriptional regulator [Acidimicrobiales bacterium]
MQHAAISRPKPLIVAHLLLLMAEEPRHGYELAASLRTWAFEGVTPSMVYRDLARLEAEGLVRSFWEASQARGPARHMYELTDAGHENLAACADDVRCLIAHLTEVLGQIEALGSVAVEDDAPAHGRRRFWRTS